MRAVSRRQPRNEARLGDLFGLLFPVRPSSTRLHQLLQAARVIAAFCHDDTSLLLMNAARMRCSRDAV